MNYTLREMMTIMAAREICDGDIVFCGTGISLVAAMAAKYITAPNSIIFFETGAIDSAARGNSHVCCGPPRHVLSGIKRRDFSRPSPQCRTVSQVTA